MTVPAPLRLLVVCTHNRVRSVMAEAFVRRAVAVRGIDAVVSGAGFSAEGLPPVQGTIAALRRHQIELGEYRSTRIDARLVDQADLVLTAERMHVVRIAEDHPHLFGHSFTLPEFVLAAEASGPRGQVEFGDWIATVGTGRTRATFLRGEAPEITDPIGQSDAAFIATAAEIDNLSQRLVALL